MEFLLVVKGGQNQGERSCGAGPKADASTTRSLSSGL
jgi:hypothetical protein